MRPYLTIALTMPKIVGALMILVSLADWHEDGKFGAVSVITGVAFVLVLYMAVVFVKAQDELVARKEKAELAEVKTQERFDELMKGFDADRIRHMKEFEALRAGFQAYFDRTLSLFIRDQRGDEADRFLSHVRGLRDIRLDDPRLHEEDLISCAAEAVPFLRNYRVASDRANSDLEIARTALIVAGGVARDTANILSDSIGSKNLGVMRAACFGARKKAIHMLIWTARGGAVDATTFRRQLDGLKEHDFLPPYGEKKITDENLPELLRIALLEAIAARQKKEEPAKT